MDPQPSWHTGGSRTDRRNVQDRIQSRAPPTRPVASVPEPPPEPSSSTKPPPEPSSTKQPTSQSRTQTNQNTWEHHSAYTSAGPDRAYITEDNLNPEIMDIEQQMRHRFQPRGPPSRPAHANPKSQLTSTQPHIQTQPPAGFAPGPPVATPQHRTQTHQVSHGQTHQAPHGQMHQMPHGQTHQALHGQPHQVPHGQTNHHGQMPRATEGGTSSHDQQRSSDQRRKHGHVSAVTANQHTTSRSSGR